MKNISETEILSRLVSDNPWWTEGFSIDEQFQDLPHRDYYHLFCHLLNQTDVRRAIVLMGPRRVGKTVMLNQSIRQLLTDGVAGNNILFASIDDPIYTGVFLNKFVNFFIGQSQTESGNQKYVFFDEIQYLKDWEVHLKTLVDRYPNIKFVASGSAAAALKLKSDESGAGRFTEFILPPLTFAEYLRFISVEEKLIRVEEPRDDARNTPIYNCGDIESLNTEFVHYLKFGGFPEAVFSPSIQQNPERYIRSDIIDKVLLRDLPVLYGIQDVQELNKLFTVLAYNTGHEISLDGLSKTSGLGKPTIKKYLEYLEAAFLIFKVRRIDDRAKDFLRERNFKAYLTNPSMRAALFGQVDANSDVMGQMAETAIFSQWAHTRFSTDLRYARWKQGEVDIVFPDFEKNVVHWIVEVKWSDRAFRHPEEFKAAIQFAKKHNLKTVRATSRSVEGELNWQNVMIKFQPTSLYCYELGKNILRSKSKRRISRFSINID